MSSQQSFDEYIKKSYMACPAVWYIKKKLLVNQSLFWRGGGLMQNILIIQGMSESHREGANKQNFTCVL
jgi:hypothetical protein